MSADIKLNDLLVEDVNRFERPVSAEEYTETYRDATLVIDNGTYFTKSGYTKDAAPRLVTPSTVARSRTRGGGVAVGWHTTGLESHRYAIRSPFRANVAQHFECLEHLVDYHLAQLGVGSDSAQSVRHDVVMTECPLNPAWSRAHTFELMFECYSVPRVAMLCDPLCAWKRHGCPRFCLVVHVGHTRSHVVPIRDGKADWLSAWRLDVGAAHGALIMRDRVRALRHGEEVQNKDTRVMGVGVGDHERDESKTKFTLNHALSFSRRFGRVAVDYDELLRKREWDELAVRIPVKKNQATFLTAQQLRARQERRKALGERLTKMTKTRKLERIAALREDINRAEELLANLASGKISRSAFETSVSDDFNIDVTDYGDAVEMFSDEVSVWHRTLCNSLVAVNEVCEYDKMTEADLTRVFPLAFREVEECEASQKRERQNQMRLLAQVRQRQQRIQDGNTPLDARLSNKRDTQQAQFEEDPKSYIAKLVEKRRGILRQFSEKIQSKSQTPTTDVVRARRQVATRVKYASVDVENMADAASWMAERAEDSEDDRAQEELADTEKLLNRFDPDQVIASSILAESRAKKRARNTGSDISVEDKLAMQRSDALYLSLERYRAGEALFRPSLWGNEQCGIGEATVRVLQSMPVDQAKELAQHIILTGAAASMPGLRERMFREVREEWPMELPLNVRVSEDPINDTWMGAAAASREPGFMQSASLTKQEFEEVGASRFDHCHKTSQLGNPDYGPALRDGSLRVQAQRKMPTKSGSALNALRRALRT
ncbi:MAG: hypothetical protein MHM6MM_001584 [Cercozoa sp. M6MM]